MEFRQTLNGSKRYNTNNLVEELQFNRTTFWVPVPGLLIKFMNARAAVKICEVLGTVLPSTNQQETEGGNFVDIRVFGRHYSFM